MTRGEPFVQLRALPAEIVLLQSATMSSFMVQFGSAFSKEEGV